MIRYPHEKSSGSEFVFEVVWLANEKFKNNGRKMTYERGKKSSRFLEENEKRD
jgi:hypothetical protein